MALLSEDPAKGHLRVKMVYVNKIFQWWNQLSINCCWCHCTTKEFLLLKKDSMASMELLTNHLNVWSVCIYDDDGTMLSDDQ